MSTTRDNDARVETARAQTNTPSAKTTGGGPKGTDQSPTDSLNGFRAPSLSLPKAGGALRSLGEKFKTNTFNGTVGISVPVAIPAGRGGLTPDLSLRYDSGSGNGPFGLGWSMARLSISRKTATGVPLYVDTIDSDVFILAGAEDLVPVLDESDLIPDVPADPELSDSPLAGAPPGVVTTSVHTRRARSTPLHEVDADHSGGGLRRVEPRGAYDVSLYRPRTEGLYARIEQHVHRSTRAMHWEVWTQDGRRSILGRATTSRVSNPMQPDQVFEWLVDETHDDRGNRIEYHYVAENLDGVDRDSPCERERLRLTTDQSQRYLKRVLYTQEAGNAAKFCFEVVLDYGDHASAVEGSTNRTIDHRETARVQIDHVPSQPWEARTDAFSTFRPGFDVRTRRLCQRVLVFHHFAELRGGAPTLVASTEFEYRTAPAASHLVGVIQRSYLQEQDGWCKIADLPQLRFDYISDRLRPTLQRPNAEGALAAGIDSDMQRLVDLHGEGLPGILREKEGALYYASSRGELDYSAFVDINTEPNIPIRSGGAQLADVNGDGVLDVVTYAPSAAESGAFIQRSDGTFSGFHPFRAMPNVEWDAPGTQLLDLSGTGRADLVVLRGDEIRWYPSKGLDGFSSPRTARLDPSDRKPVYLYDDASSLYQVADMSGDGLGDLVRICREDLTYWPNLGHGRFGPPVTLLIAQPLGGAYGFIPARVRLGDIDGTGTADVLYLESDRVRVLRNCAGNSLMEDSSIDAPCPLDDLVHVSLADIFGDGTATLLFSHPRWVSNGAASVVRLFGDEKPHLLREMDGGTGRSTRFGYTASTAFYLADRLAGRPWLTKLPFPVQLLSRVESFDEIASTRLVTKYAYHHGCYDGTEREYRGFALVESWDGESFEELEEERLFEAQIEGETFGFLRNPPAHTKTWFHTGVDFHGDDLERRLAAEYFAAVIGADGVPTALPWRIDPSGALEALAVDERREAIRALRGRPLRVEVYSVPNVPTAHPVPHTVTQSGYTPRLIQRSEGVRFNVVDVVERETVTVNYEGDRDDPRVQHRVVLSTDRFGHALCALDVAYPRRSSALADPRQAESHAVLTKTRVLHHDAPDRYRLGLPVAQSSYALSELPLLAAGAELYERDALVAWLSTQVGYSTDLSLDLPSSAPTQPQRRLISASRVLYYDDTVTAELPLGQAGRQALVFSNDVAVISATNATSLLPSEITASMLTAQGYRARFLNGEALWFLPSGRTVYVSAAEPIAANRFFTPVAVLDPLGTEYTMRYDARCLFLVETTDVHANVSTADVDYRTLQPWRVSDPNGAVSEVDFDVLGIPVTTRLKGRGEGDTDATTRLSYDLFALRDHIGPTWVRSRQRESHADPQSHWAEQKTYLDGSGRAALTKIKVEPGPVRTPGGIIHTNPRWLGDGRTVYDNKGNTVQKYEPYFSTNDGFETADEVRKVGVTITSTFDALGRLVRVDMPDGSFSRTELHAWSSRVWDGVDTCLEEGNAWQRREPSRLGLVALGAMTQQEFDAEVRAATNAEVLANTPHTTHLDSVGRPIVVEEQLAQVGEVTRLSHTRAWFDATGAQQEVRDTRNVLAEGVVRRLDGVPLARQSSDAGSRVVWTNALGLPVFTWTGEIGGVAPNADRIFREYDSLRRPTEVWAREKGAERLAEALVYGDAFPQTITNPEAAYLRGKAVRAFDGAGVMIARVFDFKGNVRERERRLRSKVDEAADWKSVRPALSQGTTPNSLAPSIASVLSADRFLESVKYDALNRPIETRFSSGTRMRGQIQRMFNERGLPGWIRATRGDGSTTNVLVSAIYDEKARRAETQHGNGVVTTFAYDPQTFRLARIVAKRANGFVLQSLRLFYDWIGNVAEIWDRSQFVSAVSNPMSADQQFEYDSLYRLIRATGREHQSVTQPDDTDLSPRSQVHPHDPSAMQRYTEFYEYDDGGNFETHRHQAGASGNSSWTRNYSVAPDSNRLTSTKAPGGGAVLYSHDARGNITEIVGQIALTWDFADRLQTADKPNNTQTVWFAYDGQGVRVRKTALSSGTRRERLYFGDFELYRDDSHVEWESLRVHDGQVCYALLETRVVEHAPERCVDRYQVTNHLGSVGCEVDANAIELSYEEYHPYGTSAYRARSGTVSPARYRYTGKERDEETGLQYHQARYYAVWLGRWISCDPAGIADDRNAYAYCHDSPITRSDKTGLAGEADDLLSAEEVRAVADKYKRPIRNSLEKELGKATLAPYQLDHLVAVNELYNQKGFGDTLTRAQWDWLFANSTSNMVMMPQGPNSARGDMPIKDFIKANPGVFDENSAKMLEGLAEDAGKEFSRLKEWASKNPDSIRSLYQGTAPLASEYAEVAAKNFTRTYRIEARWIARAELRSLQALTRHGGKIASLAGAVAVLAYSTNASAADYGKLVVAGAIAISPLGDALDHVPERGKDPHGPVEVGTAASLVLAKPIASLVGGVGVAGLAVLFGVLAFATLPVWAPLFIRSQTSPDRFLRP